MTSADLPAARTVAVPRGLVRGTGRLEGPREETSLLAFLSILLQHRRLISACALAGTVIAGLTAASQANLYESRASFIVGGSRAPQLPGGATSLGVALTSSADFSQTIIFYSDLVRSRVVLNPVVRMGYETSSARGTRRSLAEFYGIKARNPDHAARMAVDELLDRVSSSVYSRSGVVGVSVQTTDPLVSQQVATNIIAEMGVYSAQRQRQQAAEERKFVEGLVADAQAKLDVAEENVRHFLELNREYEQSPQLKLEHDRLTRGVQSRQQVFVALAQTMEQARIEEVRDPTALTVVEPADIPPEPQRKEAIRQTLLGLTIGVLVGIVLAFLRQRSAEVRVLRQVEPINV